MTDAAAWERSLSWRRGRYHWFAAGAEQSACGLVWRDFECSEGTDGSPDNCRLCEQRRELSKEGEQRLAQGPGVPQELRMEEYRVELAFGISDGDPDLWYVWDSHGRLVHDGMEEAKARRLAAMLNYCEGISTAELERRAARRRARSGGRTTDKGNGR